MTRIDVTLSDEVDALVEAAIDAGVFKGTSDAARTVTRAYFESHPDERLQIVETLYSSSQIRYLDAVRLTNIEPEDLATRLDSRHE